MKKDIFIRFAEIGTPKIISNINMLAQRAACHLSRSINSRSTGKNLVV